MEEIYCMKKKYVFRTSAAALSAFLAAAAAGAAGTAIVFKRMKRED